MQVQRTFKRREGVWGIVKQRLAQSDKRIANARHLRVKHIIGGARKLAPLSPLTKESTFGITKRCFASLNMTNGIFGGAVSSAHIKFNECD